MLLKPEPQFLKGIGLWKIKNAKLIQPVYYKDVLTSEWKAGRMLRWDQGYAYVSVGEVMDTIETDKKFDRTFECYNPDSC